MPASSRSRSPAGTAVPLGTPAATGPGPGARPDAVLFFGAAAGLVPEAAADFALPAARFPVAAPLPAAARLPAPAGRFRAAAPSFAAARPRPAAAPPAPASSGERAAEGTGAVGSGGTAPDAPPAGDGGGAEGGWGDGSRVWGLVTG
ncbi:hypothetical protein [Streptomyces sp. TS71-3]|uniref:hypothetical protein n=1 Tax=Streptomyces sp. TS71-3 TaxID=2733862 RepID=UPI001B19AFD6|nr:hypothetical protein [Streptomyces sp. TS71-3]GHJ36137.1 hypothetical protein Sm713_17460 [Streptomyces sp. TS71-3]